MNSYNFFLYCFSCTNFFLSLNRYRRSPVPYLIVSVVAIVVASSALSGVIARRNNNRNGNFTFDPTDTRLVSVSRPLCQNLKFEVDGNSVPGYSVHLYSLSSPPLLTGRETFSLVNQEPPYDPTPTYQYFMHEKSNFSVSACIIDESSMDPMVTHYVIKGHNNYRKWTGDKEHHFEHHLDIRTVCTSGNDSISYAVPSEDVYFLVFYSRRTLGDAVNISMYFERTRYEVSNGTVRQECHVTTSSSQSSKSCGVGLPLFGATNLFTVEPEQGHSDDRDWRRDEIYVSIGCSARIWMYAIICLCVLIGVVAILFVFSVFLNWFAKYQRNKKQTSYPPVDVSRNGSVNDSLIKESSIRESSYPGYGTNSRKQ